MATINVTITCRMPDFKIIKQRIERLTPVPIEELLGKTLTEVDVTHTEALFVCNDGSIYRMCHYQDCCESVWLEDIDGDFSLLLGKPILRAEKVTNSDDPQGDESWTWTFYKLANNRESVTMRWYGESNGYYSEDVDFERIG